MKAPRLHICPVVSIEGQREGGKEKGGLLFLRAVKKKKLGVLKALGFGGVFFTGWESRVQLAL